MQKHHFDKKIFGYILENDQSSTYAWVRQSVRVLPIHLSTNQQWSGYFEHKIEPMFQSTISTKL